MTKNTTLFLVFFLYCLPSIAADFLVVEGKLTDSAGLVPIEEPNVVFTLDIYSPGAEQCLLYRETHPVNMTGSKGFFSFNLGTGSRSGTDYEDISSLTTALSNSTGTVNPTDCAAVGNYTPSSTDGRLLSISYNDGINGLQTLQQDIQIGATAYALSAASIDGLSGSDLIKVNSTGAELTQANLETIFASATDVSELRNLIDGTSSQYNQGVPTAAVDNNGQVINNVATPSVGTDATNKNYVDTQLGGHAIDPGFTPNDGETLVWSNSNSRWEAATLAASDVTKLPLAGGTMSGAINMGSQDITNASDIGSATLSVSGAATITGGLTAAGGIGTNGINSSGNINLANETEVQFAENTGNGTNYVALKAPATLAADVTWTLPATDGTPGQVLQTDGSGVLSWITAGGGGEVNTAANVGNAGIGIYDAKNAAVLEFRNINAASTKISVNLDGPNKNIDIDVNEANLDPSLIPNTPSGDIAATNLQAAIAELDTEKVSDNRMIDTILGASGLAGGGDLSADLSLTVDINGTTALGGQPAGTDTLLIHTGGGLKKVTRNNLVLDESEVDAYVANNNYLLNDGSVFRVDGTLPMTGDFDLGNNNLVNLALGSAAAPSLSFNGDANTGLYSSGADSLTLAVAGNDALSVMAGGDVDISQNLIVQSSVHATSYRGPAATTAIEADDYIVFKGNVNDTTGGFRFQTGSVATDRVLIDNQGKMGLGTTSPGEKLDVNGNVRIDGSVQLGNGAVTCASGADDGKIRWNSATSSFEGCSGGSWASLQDKCPAPPWQAFGPNGTAPCVSDAQASASYNSAGGICESLDPRAQFCSLGQLQRFRSAIGTIPEANTLANQVVWDTAYKAVVVNNNALPNPGAIEANLANSVHNIRCCID